ncbi:MAG: hypothetical protein OER97_01600 [Gammaproteobacteria bacterium]|nr:hypothetical protein [Gammaproteobacteria bacterium]
MVKIITAVLGGLLVGIAISYVAFVAGPKSPAENVVRDIVDVPKMSETVAEQHREKRYADLTTIEEIYALPTDFSRSEALHALAGRSNAAQVQNLIFEANRIADEVGRNGALTVLFFRLAEEDPQSALAMSRTEYFRGNRALEFTVWRSWGRKNLDDALFAAKTQTSRAHQNTAAQSLYAAFGFMDNETTDRIEAELGIGPDRATRSRFLYRMADRSPAEAIAYINDMPSGQEQQEFVNWLAYYLSLRDATDALRHADLFENADFRKRYRRTVANYAAQEDPKAAIERILATGGLRNDRGEFYSAMRALAKKDLDAALQYFSHARSQQEKQSIGSVVVVELARRNPAEALEWARANHSGEHHYLEMNALAEIAKTDPQYAIAEALRSKNSQTRQQLVSSILSQLVQENPVEAIGFLDLIDNRQLRDQTESHVASNWIRTDPDAALEWILSKDEQTVARLLNDSAWGLLRTDVDAAIRVLPRLNKQQQQNWRLQIADRLANSRSLAEAQNFIRQFDGEEGFDQLQSTVISAIARNDTMLARQMADQLTDRKARDAAYAAIISQNAQTDPRAAAAMLSSITDEHYRGVATAQIAAQWYNVDPAAANRWVANMPAGASRDDAIMHLAGNWTQPDREQQALIDSIQDRDKRGQAKLRRVYNLMRSNPAQARELLDDPDISSYQRQQVETMLRNQGARF